MHPSHSRTHAFGRVGDCVIVDERGELADPCFDGVGASERVAVEIRQGGKGICGVRGAGADVDVEGYGEGEEDEEGVGC